MRGSSAVATLAFFGLVSGFVLVGGGRSVSACSCVGYTDDEAFAAADAVFTGVLLEIQTPPGDAYSSADPERFVFQVDEVFKGKAFARQSVVTAREGASCGLEIAGSGPFVVFARNESDGIVDGAAKGEVYSNLCSGTRPLSERVVPTGFGEGRAPTSQSPSVAQDPTTGDAAGVLWQVALPVLIAVGLLGGWVLVRSRRVSRQP